MSFTTRRFLSPNFKRHTEKTFLDNYIAQTGQKITGLMPEKRDTTTPKGSRLLKAFDSLSVVKIEHAHAHRAHFVLSDLSSVQRQIIQALGVAELSTYLAGLAPRVEHSATAVMG